MIQDWLDAVKAAKHAGLKHGDKVLWTMERGIVVRAVVDTRNYRGLGAAFSADAFPVWSPHLTPDTEGIRWVRSWSEEAEQALRAADAL